MTVFLTGFSVYLLLIFLAMILYGMLAVSAEHADTDEEPVKTVAGSVHTQGGHDVLRVTRKPDRLAVSKTCQLVVTMPGERTMTLYILGIRTGRVEVGIDAPLDVKVRRAELGDEKP